MEADYTVLDIETTGQDPWSDHLVAVGLGDEVHRPDAGRQLAIDLLASEDSLVVCHTNYDLRWLLLDGATMSAGMRYHDTKVMAFLLDATQEFSLEALAWKYLGVEMDKRIHRLKGIIMFRCDDGKSVPIEEAPWDDMYRYNIDDVKTTAMLYEHLRFLLIQQGWWEHFLEEEAPFSKLLVEMEEVGLPLNKVEAEKMLVKTSAERDSLAESLVEETGVLDFNLKSGDQVAAYLYDELPTFKVKHSIPLMKGIPKEEKDAAIAQMFPNVNIEKVGNIYVYGTMVALGRGLEPPKFKQHSKDMRQDVKPKRPPIDAESLALMHGADHWVSSYLKWKSLNTLCRNYLEVWVEREHNGRLHGRFDQARAETGRITSRDPNLQSVPAVGGGVRHLFRAPLFVGDYAGLDARVAAHFSEDPLMLEIFRSGQDLYGVLAANAWGGAPDKSNPNRSLMKILFLSVQYSAAAGSLGDKIRVSGQPDKARQAPQLLRNLEETLPRLFAWKDEVLRESQTLGYVTTLAGRRRQLPNLDSPIWKIKAREERKAVASKVQGSSADIVRRCMLACREQIPHEEARILLQVHDEILWERGPSWTDETEEKIIHLCETAHAFDLEVPMVFSAAKAESWEDKDAEGARSYRTVVIEKGV